MDKYKEFLGKNFDDCIVQAVNYFGCPRESLELELIQDAKSGIFGIVGARKAKIKARRAHIKDTVASLLGKRRESDDLPSNEAQQPPQERKGQAMTAAARKNAQAQRPAESRPKRQRDKATRVKEQSPPENAPPTLKDVPAPQKETEKSVQADKADLTCNTSPPAISCDLADQDMDMADELDGSPWPVIPVEELDRQRLETNALEIVGRLVRPIAGCDIVMNFDIFHGAPRVRIEWEGDAGLLIGKDGQTLTALQYMASRLLARSMGAALRVQLDIGDYRARQEDRLKELARSLAEKARQTGRPFSTRPMSSYHRRIVHLCLRDEADVQTRSAGDGPLKRVLISPRRQCQQ